MKKKSDSKSLFQFHPAVVFGLGALFPFLFFLIAYGIIGVFPFGDKLLLPSDSFSQYFPFLLELKRKLSGGSLFYSFSGGMGYDFWSTLAYYAASPLNLLLLFIPESGVGDYMAWMSVLKVSLCGGIFAWYLYRQSKDYPLFAVAFGTMYACSGFFIGLKFNIMWLDSISVVPLVMFGLEKVVHRDGSSVYLLSLAFAIWCNYYIGFMVCLFSCLYLVFLLIQEKTEKNSLLIIIPSFAFSSLAAGGISSVLLLPSFLSLRATTSVVGGESPGFRFYNNFISMLRAHYMESGFYRTSRNPGDVALYCGVIVFFLVLLFFSEKKFSPRLRIGYGVFLGFLLLSFTFSPLNFLWHGFHNQNNVPNRFAFLYLLLLLKLCYTVLPELKNVDEKRMNRVVIAVFAVSAVFFVWDLVGQHDFRVTLSFAFLMLYAVLLYEIRSGSKKKEAKLFPVVLCALLLVESCSAVLIDTSLNGEGKVRSYYLGWQRDYRQLMKEQDFQEFSRTEADSDEYNFVPFLGGSGVSLFNSTMQDNIRTFLDALNVHTEMNAVLCRTPAKLVSDLLGIRYRVTEQTSSDTLDGFVQASTLNGKTLYENPDALSIGYIVPEIVTSWVPDKGSGMDGLNRLAQLLCNDEELTLYSPDHTFSGESGEPVSFDVPEGVTLYVMLDEGPLEVNWETPQGSYSNSYEIQLDHILFSAVAEENNHTAVLTPTTIEGNPYTGTAYFCREEDYLRALETLSKSQLQDVTVSGNRVSGHITAEQNGILLMTIPYNRGWHITVDGSPADSQEVGSGLIGIPLSEGEHAIHMRYTPPGFTAGCILSVCSLLLASAVLFLGHRKRTNVNT